MCRKMLFNLIHFYHNSYFHPSFLFVHLVGVIGILMLVQLNVY